MSIDILWADMTIGQRVRAARKKSGWSSNRLDREAGLSSGMTSRIERGHRPRVEAVTIGKLAQVLRVTTDFLILGIEPPITVEATPVNPIRKSPRPISSIPPGPSYERMNIKSAWELAVTFARANGYEEQDIETARGIFTFYDESSVAQAAEFFDEIRKAFTRRVQHDSEQPAPANAPTPPPPARAEVTTRLRAARTRPQLHAKSK